MATALQQVLDQLQKMTPERQEAFARLLLREIRADEQWRQSSAQHAEWEAQRRGGSLTVSGQSRTTQ